MNPNLKFDKSVLSYHKNLLYYNCIHLHRKFLNKHRTMAALYTSIPTEPEEESNQGLVQRNGGIATVLLFSMLGIAAVTGGTFAAYTSKSVQMASITSEQERT